MPPVETHAPVDEIASRARVGLPWLVRLRWGAIGLEVAAVAVAQLLAESVQATPWILGCIAVSAASNVMLGRPRHSPASPVETLWGVALALDVTLFSVILHLTGGPWNPFSVLYLVYIALAAVVLGAAWTWGLAALAIACYGGLFVVSGTPAEHAMHAGDPGFLLHLRGMWLAFALAATLTAHFVVRLSSAIEIRDAEIAAVREQAARSERLAALTTLAAGAAHELGTPLATIAIAAGELDRAVARLPEPQAGLLREDTRLIRAELARCRHILDRMSAEAGTLVGEAPAAVPCASLILDVIAALAPHEAARVDVGPLPSRKVAVPRHAFTQAISSLVRNALDATHGTGGRVRVGVAVEPDGLRIIVRDDGPGMSAEVLARAGEPFFSTKPTGRGLGLGLFLTRALAERMGGRLVLESKPGAGATVAFELPVNALANGASRA